MTISARPLRPPSAPARKTLAAALLGAVAALALIAPPAGAKVLSGVASEPVGVQPRSTLKTEGLPGTFANEDGNAIVDGSQVYAVYWDPGDVFFDQHHEWLVKVDQFLQQLGSASGGESTIFGTLGQYRERSNAGAVYSTVFKGSYTDSADYPSAVCTDPEPLASEGVAACLTDTQIREQLETFIAEHDLPKGMNAIYYLITPPGVAVCLNAASTHCSDYSLDQTEEEKEELDSTSYKDSFCSYHGAINPDNAVEGDGNTILYAVVPWDAAGNLGNPFEFASARVYDQGYPCQDGGWNPEKGKEKKEEAPVPTKEEEEILKGEKGTAEEEAALVEKRRLEGPHQEEPNQEGRSEDGSYSAGLADLIDNQIAMEQANIVTDPLLNAWKNASGDEVTDLCRNIFAGTAGPGGGEIGGSATALEGTEAGNLFNTEFAGTHYYINNVFSLSGDECAGGVGLVPRFTSPNPVNNGETVGFDGMESTVSLLSDYVFGPSGPPTKTYATFTWNFGDGSEVSGLAPNSPPCEAPWSTSPCAGSVFHSYQYGGKYEVKLTITDVAGNVASVEHEVTVNGPPAPSTPSGSGGSSGGASASAGSPSSSASGSGSSSPGAGTSASVPAPVATAAIVRQSLKQVTRKGLAVRYSVNEQVAGHFEVLLSSAVAKRLRIKGTQATGLPAGSAPQLVIAKAILVTTKGGRSAVRIHFSKATAARLRRARRVSLMLRLVVRNAATSNPASTTVISSVTLSR